MKFRFFKKKKNLFAVDNKKYYINGDLFEDVVFKTKNDKLIIIQHIRFCDDTTKELTTYGTYKIFNQKENKIGHLKYVFDDREQNNAKMILCDIYFEPQYRNIGIGTKLLELFEKRSFEYGAKQIVGSLSDVDTAIHNSRILRDSFYIKNGYSFINYSKVIKQLNE